MSPLERRDTSKLDALASKKDMGDRVVLNVGGKLFEPYISTLRNIPDIPLSRILENRSKLDYDPETGGIFFRSTSRRFRAGFELLTNGKTSLSSKHLRAIIRAGTRLLGLWMNSKWNRVVGQITRNTGMLRKTCRP